MNRVSSIFSQILQVISRPEFASIVGRHKGERHARGFSCWTQLSSMLFRQLGLDGAPARSTLSCANEHRPWEVFRDLFFVLRDRLAGEAAGRGHRFRFRNRLVSLDSSTVTLRCRCSTGRSTSARKAP